MGHEAARANVLTFNLLKDSHYKYHYKQQTHETGQLTKKFSRKRKVHLSQQQPAMVLSQFKLH